MKRAMAGLSLALAFVILMSIPSSAASIITGDSFSSTKKLADWVTDIYEPEEFDVSGGELYLALGKSGYYKYRSADKKAKTYAMQGKKLAVKKPSSTTWTATVKINIDDAWMSGTGNKKAEFRVDLVDGKGKAIAHSPTISLVRPGNGSPALKYYNPKAKNSWGTANTFINGDKETEELVIEEGWHTLIIKSTKGVISYYFDEKKLGNCTLNTKDVYPSYMALGAYNYDRPDVINFDNCYLYDGSYAIRQLSSSAAERKEERLASKYESKRERWIEKYTYYTFKDDNKEYTKAQAEAKGYDIEKATSSKLRKEIPDSYWDY